MQTLLFTRSHSQFFLTVVVLLLLAGCGGNSPVGNSSGSRVEAAPTQNEAAPAVGGVSEVGREEVPSKSHPAVSRSVAQNESQPGKPQPAKEAVPQAKLPQPSAEQLARWQRVEHAPLQLLEFREEPRVGFFSKIEATTDGKQFVTAGSKLCLWSVDGKTPPHVLLDGAKEEEAIVSLAMSPKGDWAAVLQKNGQLRIFGVAEHQELRSKKLGSSDLVQVAISPDASELATVSRIRKVTVLNAESLKETNKFEIDASDVARLEYIGPHVLVAAGESTSSWETQTGKLVQKYPAERYQQIAERSPDGASWLFAAKEGLAMWSTSDDRQVGTISDSFGRSDLVRFSSDGLRLASLNGASIRIWDTATGQLLQIIDHTGWEPVGLCWIPGTRLLITASDSGRTRVWGSGSDATSLGLNPLHTAVALPDRAARVPATTDALLQAIDLRLFPRFPGAKPNGANHDAINVELPTTVDEARLFYRYWFHQFGWKEVADATSSEMLSFEKDGFEVSMSAYQSSPTQTFVNVNHLGNYQYAWVPKLESVPVEIVFESRHTTIYKSKASLLQVETELLQRLTRAGWTAISPLNRSGGDNGDSRDMSFVWNGVILRVSIQPDREDRTKQMVSYTKSLTPYALPIPPDCGLVEFNDFLEMQLVANTKLSMEQATEFYQQAMLRQGWLVRPSGEKITPELCWLPFLRGHHDITIELVKLDDGRTQIRAGKYSDTSWQLAILKAKQKAEATTTDAKAGIQAADFPILAAVNPPKYDAAEKSITFEIKPGTDLIALCDQYFKSFKSLDWSAKHFVGTATKEGFRLLIKKDEANVYFNVDVSPNNTINATVDGADLLWTKEVPKSAQRTSYANWLRQRGHLATLDLLDQFKAEMEKLPDHSP